jgi:hypothetical protein
MRRGALFLSFALCACAMQRAEDAALAQKAMVGMSKARVFACMGIPKKKAIEENIEIWSYKSGNDYTEHASNRTTFSAKRYMYGDGYTDVFGDSLGFGEGSSEKRYCIVQVVMTEGKVQAVNYTGPTGGLLTDDEQCAFAVRNCLPRGGS